MTVVHEANLVDALRLVITATAQVLIDVLEVWQAHLHLEVVGLGRFREGQ